MARDDGERGIRKGPGELIATLRKWCQPIGWTMVALVHLLLCVNYDAFDARCRWFERNVRVDLAAYFGSSPFWAELQGRNVGLVGVRS